MFDELHDPTPPSADSHHFAAVAERASAMRRRRRTIVGAASAVALIAGGALVMTTIGDGGGDRLATLDAAADTTAPVVADAPTSLPASTVTDQPAITVAPSAPSSTTAPTPTTTVVDGGEISPVIGEPIPLECGGFRVCTFDHLADGRLVQIGNDGSEAGPPTFTIYDDDATSVDATGLLGNFDAVSTYLVDVGPGDIAYVWYIERDGGDTARMGAFELTGPDAGRQIIEFDAELDMSGDTEQVPTRDGFVQVGCCGPDTVRPAPDAEVVIPWVDRDGNEITNDDDTFFSVEFIDGSLTVDAVNDQSTRSWDLGFQEFLPRGLPALHQLDDDRVVYVYEDPHSAGPATPVYLDPDGSVEVGARPGAIIHVLPDGRVVLNDFDEGTYSLATLGPPVPADVGDPSPPPPTTIAPEPAIAQPLIAITADGDAVYFDADDADPTLIFDGPAVAETTIGDGPNAVDRIAYSAVHDWYTVALCCSPIVGTFLTDSSDRLPITEYTPEAQPEHVNFSGYGYAPTTNAQGGRLAAIGPESTIEVSDTATGLGGSVELDAAAGAPWDLAWIDHDRVGVIGRLEDVWTLTVLRYENELAPDRPDDRGGSLTVESSRPFGLAIDFDNLVFAGTARDGEIAIHDVDSDTVLSGTIDAYGNNNGDEAGSSLDVITLPAAARSAWFFDPGQLIWVDTAGVLRVGDRIIPGTYTWARR